MTTPEPTALRDRIAEALIAWTYRGKDPEHGGILETVRANAYSRADAVLPLLPAPVDRAAVLREVETALRARGKRLTGEYNDSDILHEDGPAATVATWKRAAELVGRMADEAQPTQPQQDEAPRRGDRFEAWLKAQRDEYEQTTGREWRALDEVLDTYRLHADMGVPLDGHACEARVVGDCECLEQPAAEAQQDDPKS